MPGGGACGSLGRNRKKLKYLYSLVVFFKKYRNETLLILNRDMSPGMYSDDISVIGGTLGEGSSDALLSSFLCRGFQCVTIYLHVPKKWIYRC